MDKVTKGLVLRETRYKEADKILTVLTESDGRITVSARGARRKSSKIGAAAQLLAFSEMTLFEYRGRFSMREAEVIEMFPGLRSDISLLALGSYFAELLEYVSMENVPEAELLSLGLNALYAVSELKLEPEKVKAAFELRLMCAAGFEPALSECSGCLAQPERPYFDMAGGALLCEKCARPGDAALSAAALAASRYVVSAEPKKLFSFKLSEPALKDFSAFCERYALTQIERDFRTLAFWKQVRAL